MLLPSSIKRLYPREATLCNRTLTLRNLTIFWVLAAGFVFFSACASMPARQAAADPSNQFPEYTIISGVAMAPEFADGNLPDTDILFLDKEVIAILDDTVTSIENPHARLNAIIAILNDKIRYDTETDKYATKTALETYKTGTGNCLSFTNLFVAMARHVGLEAGYQEVSTRPNWNPEGGVMLVSRHIGAYASIFTPFDCNIDLAMAQDDTVIIQSSRYGCKVKLGTNASRAEREASVTYTPIPDHRAFAQYYNNVAAMNLAKGNSAGAFRYFSKALQVDPGLYFVWSNLGVAYSRNHRLKAAEEAFLKALSIAGESDGTAVLRIMNNMTKLYERTGDEEKADFYRNQVAAFREQNPYYHYLAGQTDFSNAAYKKSIKHFKAAIRKKSDEDRFYYSLALAYLKLGDLRNAEKNIDKARLHAWDDQRKQYYDEVLKNLTRTALN